ncbi:MAG TPA: tetratricopeptide repeat protein [Candidatus Acidoferrum sp.]|nr:tetratricopeptide repeat protein [Candidatus Acidoferrum sp.]
MRRISLLVLVLASFGGVTPAQDWTTVRSPHFVVSTDAGEKRSREVAVRFEQLRLVFEKLLSNEKLNSPVPLQILGFRNAKGFSQVAPLTNGKPDPGLLGLFQTGGDMNFIALDLSTEAGFPVVFHEYTHTVLHANFRHLPLWFDEGVARYYETAQLVNGRAQIGATPKYLDTFLYGRALMPVTELFGVTNDAKIYGQNSERRELFYDQSWAVVHYLFDKQKMADFGKYVELTANQHMPIPGAIEAAFHMTPKEFDKEIASYLHLSLRQIYFIDDSTSIDESSFVSQPLEPIDAEALIANMHWHSMDYHVKAVEEYKDVLAKNPNQIDANLALGYAALISKNYDEAETYLRKAASVDKKNARCQFLLGILQLRRSSTNENKQDLQVDAWNHLKAATTLSPELAEAHSELAYALSQMGDKDGAIKEAATAARLNQGNESYFVNLAELYFQAKKYEQAKATFAQLTSSNDPKIAALANQRLETLKTSDGSPNLAAPKQ